LPTYFNALRPDPHYRREIFDAGLRSAGYTPADTGKCDVYVTWNRYGTRERLAEQVEARGGRVLVAENATWGNDFNGGRWYSIWSGFHNRADGIRYGGHERWDSLGFVLQPWRQGGTEIVGLQQRGIGPRGTPQNWQPPGCTRIRKHPGIRACVPLAEDLANASEVRTWGSGAAVKALMWGIPVRSYMPRWCGEQQNTDESRREMLRRLAWAQWTLEEIADGAPFRWLA
jgi:hypothetical protein